MLDSQAKYMKMRKHKDSAVQSDTITAPMPCKIVKVYCKPGDKIKEGETLFTMEAMKMQSNYKVSADCEVAQVMIQDGDTVSAEQVLVKLKVDDKKE